MRGLTSCSQLCSLKPYQIKQKGAELCSAPFCLSAFHLFLSILTGLAVLTALAVVIHPDFNPTPTLESNSLLPMF